METRGDWQQWICLALFIPVSNHWFLQLFWRHCVVQKFPVVDYGLDGFGFHLNLMIGLDNSLLTIIDEYFVG